MGGLRYWLHITGDNLEKHSTESLNGVGSFWGKGKEGSVVCVVGGTRDVGGATVAHSSARLPGGSAHFHLLSLPVPPSFCCFGVRLFELTLLKKILRVLSREQRSKVRAKVSISVLRSSLLSVCFVVGFFFKLFFVFPLRNKHFFLSLQVLFLALVLFCLFFSICEHLQHPKKKKNPSEVR